MELSEKVYTKIVELCENGDKYADKDEFDKAIQNYLGALELIPEPKVDWEASTWIYTALGDACYHKKDYLRGSNFFYDALNCPDALGNPFILIRLGQCLYEQGDIEKSKEYLLRAYMMEGDDIFDEEDDKYLKVISDLL